MRCGGKLVHESQPFSWPNMKANSTCKDRTAWKYTQHIIKAVSSDERTLTVHARPGVSGTIAWLLSTHLLTVCVSDSAGRGLMSFPMSNMWRCDYDCILAYVFRAGLLSNMWSLVQIGMRKLFLLWFDGLLLPVSNNVCWSQKNSLHSDLHKN